MEFPGNCQQKSQDDDCATDTEGKKIQNRSAPSAPRDVFRKMKLIEY